MGRSVLGLLLFCPSRAAVCDGDHCDATQSETRSDEEVALRRTVAAGYRLLELHGHGDLAAGFFTTRSLQNASIMYVAEQGLHFGEVRASDLVPVDIITKSALLATDGRRVSFGALQVATAVYRRHPEINAFLHSHPSGAMALAALQDPRLLMMTEPSFMFYERVALANTDFFFENEYAEAVAAKLDGGKFLVHARNHAIFVAGKDVPQAFYRAYMFEQAAGLQLKAMSLGQPLRETSHEESVYHRRSCEEWEGGFDGSLEWPGLLRRLVKEGAGDFVD